MDQEIVIKACKYCGSRKQIFDHERKIVDGVLRGLVFCVVCKDCGAQGPWEDTEERAAEAWNMIE